MGIRRLGVNPPKLKRRAGTMVSEDLADMLNREYMSDILRPYWAGSHRQRGIPVSANTRGGCGGCASFGRRWQDSTFLRANRAKNLNLVRL